MNIFLPLKDFARRGKNAVKLLLIKIQTTIRVFQKKPVIHIIGDSHSLLFQDKRFIIHYIGSATAFKLHSDTSKTQSKQKILKIMNGMKDKKNIFLMVFGEIDSRIHIYNSSVLQKIPLRTVVINTVESYGNFIVDLQKKYSQNKYLIFNILPAGEEKNIYNVKNYASRAIRFEITQMMNQELARFCKKNKIAFIDIFNELVDAKHKRINKYVFDEVHYNEKIVPYIIEELKKYLYL